MYIGGALEFIQSFNNPKIIDAPDSSLQEGKLQSRRKLLTFLRDFIQLLKLFIKVEDNLLLVPLKLSSRTVLVTYCVSLLFSETPFEDVLMCSLSSFHTD